ncbi:MAG: acetate uptake transporter [Nitrososphaerales archaeon]|jgi:succinate-acetate transporter protein
MAQNEPSKTDMLLANPAPLGLMAFGTTTVLLNLANAGAIPLDSIVLAMGLLYGGVAQVIAGIFEFRKGNTFGMTAFISYGFFWISLVFILSPAQLLGASNTAASLSSYLFVWGLVSFFMFLGTLRLNGSLMFVFGSLFILFFLLSAGFAWNNSDLLKFAGYEGVLCGLSAMYTSTAEILNEVYRRPVLPTFPVKPKS